MNEMNIFNEKNINELIAICDKTKGLLGDHCNGSLMASQQMALGKLIKDYMNNPIIATSGIKPEIQP